MEQSVEECDDGDVASERRRRQIDDGTSDSLSESEERVLEPSRTSKVFHRDSSRGQGKSKFLIFSASGNHEGGGRGRGRGRAAHRNGDDRDNNEAPHFKKGSRFRNNYDKSNDDSGGMLEDGRIGRQLRLLSRELDEDNVLKICQQLQDSFLVPENLRYIRYNLLTIGNSLMEAFKLATSAQTRSAVALTLARLGYVSDHEFHSFSKWILSAYLKERTEKNCCAIMDALTEMLHMDELNPRLKNVDTHLLGGLQSALESADSAALFQSALRPVLVLAGRNPHSFLHYFRDTVDILVGWFIDPSQPVSVAAAAGRALRDLHPFWGEDLSFSLTLLTQFLEDLDTNAAEAALSSSVGGAETSLCGSLRKIASLLSVFSLVGTEVGSFPDTSNVFSFSFLNAALSKIGLCTLELLADQRIGGMDDEATAVQVSDVVHASNDCLGLLVRWLGPAAAPAALRPAMQLLDRQIRRGHVYQYAVLVSQLRLMTSLVEGVASQVTADSLQLWMDAAHWLVDAGRRPDLLRPLARLYRALIHIKNVPLLIEVYRRLAADLDACFADLDKTSSAGYRVTEAEERAIFLLSPLADLGRSSSFVGMWALEPSLLDLLSGKLQPVETLRRILRSHPALLLGVLRVLHGHAQSHNHFVANSALVGGGGSSGGFDGGGRSPTSGNLAAILNLLTDLCVELSAAPAADHAHTAAGHAHAALKLLLLSWSAQVLTTCRPCTAQLKASPLFRRFLTALVSRLCLTDCARHRRLDQAVAALLHTVLDLPDVGLDGLVLDVAGTCIAELRSQTESSAVGFRGDEEQQQQRWVHLLGRCPPAVVRLAVERWRHGLYSTTGLSSWVRPDESLPGRHLQHFFDHLLRSGADVAPPPVRSIYALQHGGGGGVTKTPAASAALAASAASPVDVADLPAWLAAQCALFCVNNKLRTPLGKPQDTFLTIEEAIKNASRDDGRAEVAEVAEVAGLARLERVHLLLSFYEFLERFMFNAFDGCSGALPAAPKAVRVFFRTNQTTCQEWVHRLCGAALTASVHAGRHASAVRYGLNILHHWAQQQRVVDAAELDAVLEQLIPCLVQLGASQPLRGLNKWLAGQANLAKLVDPRLLLAAALQAESKHEEAIEMYALVPMGESDQSRRRNRHVWNQTVDSYTALADWQGLQHWKSQLGDWNGRSASTDGRAMSELLRQFDEQEHLQEWPPEEAASTAADWSVAQLVGRAKASLLVTADRIRWSRSLHYTPETAWKVVEFQTAASVRLAPAADDDDDRSASSTSTWLPLAHALSAHDHDSAYRWTQRLHDHLGGCCASSPPLARSSLSLEWSRWLHWYLSVDGQAASIAAAAGETDLLTVALARREGNLRLAERQLLQRLLNAQTASHQGKRDLATLLTNEALRMPLTGAGSALAIRTQLEGAKLLHMKGETESALDALTQCTLALSRALRSAVAGGGGEAQALRPHLAESHLLLADWLHHGQSAAGSGGGPLRNVASLQELAPAPAPAGQDDASADGLVRRLMERASQLAPDSASGWLAWGRFQYGHAQRLATYDVLLRDLLKDVLQPAQLQRLLASIADLTVLSANVDCVLTSDPALAKKPALLQRVLERVHGQQVAAADHYHQAVAAFFTFLQVEAVAAGEADAVDATLRILHVSTRHLARDDRRLASLLEQGLERTPSSAWRALTPQLFSLLQRGRPWFRRAVSRLLARLTVQWPHLLLFPAAVGEAGLAWSWSSESSAVDDAGAEDVAAAADESLCTAAELKATYGSLMTKLTKEVPDMVRDVRLFMQELSRLVLLWDELWVAMLQQIHPQVEQLMAKLNVQLQKLQKKPNLTDAERKQLVLENYQVLFKPIVLTLEAVASVTSQPAQTPHEQLFHHRYGRVISEGIAALRNFGADGLAGSVDRPQDLWLPFKNMFQQLQHVSYRRSVLKLDDASPLLKSLKDTFIPMPGVGCDRAGELPLRLRSVDATAIVLPTKTKPKKLLFVGSDGRRYAYLFKGMEDLHLDERIMQILSVANILLAEDGARDRTSKAAASGGSTGYRARHYRVIPMGPRSGLIQWVEGVTPLFAIYKRWLQRQTAQTLAQGKTEKDDAATLATVPRPSELFFHKLTPLLEAQGLSSDPRHRNQWPVATLRQVLRQLMDDTPKDLVARELWLGSVTAQQWWQSTLRFGRSCAVMSIIGYVIGLGDRHLDNVLVDLRCGEVVHIDYNVCFEKGRQLRVPENVPFRLTANIQHALGVAGTGVEGTFRHSCVDVLATLRRHGHLFQVLLEHFVYDPLIDWRVQWSGTGHESTLVPLSVLDPALAARCSRRKRALEHLATFQLFRLRTSELGPDWTASKTQLRHVVDRLERDVAAWLELDKDLSRLRDEAQDLHEERLALLAVGADAGHLMRQPQQLEALLAPLRAAWDGELVVRRALDDMLADNKKWIQFYEMAFASLTGGQLERWNEATAGSTVATATTGFLLVEDFLNSSGQIALALQGQTLEQQVASLMADQRAAASLVVNLLARYATVAAVYPPTKLADHRVSLVSAWIRRLQADSSSANCRRLAEAFEEHINAESALQVARRLRVAAFKTETRQLLSDAGRRLDDPTLQPAEPAQVDAAAGQLLDSKEVVGQFMILHGAEPTRRALAQSLRRAQRQTGVVESAAAGASTLDAVGLLCGAVALTAELVSTAVSDDTSQFEDAAAVVQSLRQLLQDLQEFVYNGTTIVLPEMIRLFESSDASVLHVYRELQALCAHMSLSKMELISARFQDLLAEAATGDAGGKSLAAGQMLLLCINGLFDKMESGLASLTLAFDRGLAADPSLQPRLEPLRTARLTLGHQVYEKLDQALLAKRLSLMLSLFESCSRWTSWFRAEAEPAAAASADSSDLFRHKFQSLADLWAGQFLDGVPVLAMAHLENLLNGGSGGEPAGTAGQELLEQACLLVTTVESDWQKCQLIKMTQQRREMEQSVAAVLQQQLSAHSWLHDAGVQSACAGFVLELRQALSFLLPQSTQLAEMLQPVTQLAAQVEQRLRWAAGANPSLHRLLNHFTSVQEKCLQQLEVSSSMATSLGAVGSALLHFENLRSRTQEALELDAAYFRLLSQLQHVQLVKECAAGGQLSAAEIRLAKRLPVDQPANWIDDVETVISEAIAANKSRAGEVQAELAARTEAMRGDGNAELRAVLTAHHQLISDVRSALKAMAKGEPETPAGPLGPVGRYLETYRQFSELCSAVSRHLAAVEYDGDKVAEILDQISALKSIMDIIYDGLEKLSETPSQVEQRAASSATPEVNAVAASVWHRVRLKLEGRDPLPNDGVGGDPLSVEDQVDAIIDEATNVDNLALLYEGWTPWV